MSPQCSGLKLLSLHAAVPPLLPTGGGASGDSPGARSARSGQEGPAPAPRAQISTTPAVPPGRGGGHSGLRAPVVPSPLHPAGRGVGVGIRCTASRVAHTPPPSAALPSAPDPAPGTRGIPAPLPNTRSLDFGPRSPPRTPLSPLCTPPPPPQRTWEAHVQPGGAMGQGSQQPGPGAEKRQRAPHHHGGGGSNSAPLAPRCGCWPSAEAGPGGEGGLLGLLRTQGSGGGAWGSRWMKG